MDHNYQIEEISQMGRSWWCPVHLLKSRWCHRRNMQHCCISSRCLQQKRQCDNPAKLHIVQSCLSKGGESCCDSLLYSPKFFWWCFDVQFPDSWVHQYRHWRADTLKWLGKEENYGKDQESISITWETDARVISQGKSHFKLHGL